MTKPVVKHKVFGSDRHFLYGRGECGLYLSWRRDRHRIARTWPATTCKNCLRHKPKARKPDA